MIWFGQSLYWIGTQACDGTVRYALLRQMADTPSEIVWDLDSPAYCHDTATGQLHVLAQREGKTHLGTVSAAGAMLSGRDPVDRISACQKSTALTVQRFRAETGTRAFAIAMGREATLICLRGDAQTSQLAWLRDNRAEPFAALETPLVRHNPALEVQAYGGGFLAYPALTFDQRRDLSADLSGIPVHFVSTNSDLRRIDVPWAAWNASGDYRPVMTVRGLVMSASPNPRKTEQPLGGLYLLQDGWRQHGASDIDCDSLAVSADGTQLAWRKRLPASAESAYSLQFLTL